MTLSVEKTAKKPYKQPALRVFGDVRALTGAGMPGTINTDSKGISKTS